MKSIKTIEDFKEWINEKETEYKYMFLDRMRMDCGYVIDTCGATPSSMKHLWFENDPVTHIEAMKYLWSILPEKPEWLTMEQIVEYESKLCGNNELLGGNG